jgi:hypothetical protein
MIKSNNQKQTVSQENQSARSLNFKEDFVQFIEVKSIQIIARISGDTKNCIFVPRIFHP